MTAYIVPPSDASLLAMRGGVDGKLVFARKRRAAGGDGGCGASDDWLAPFGVDVDTDAGKVEAWRRLAALAGAGATLAEVCAL